MSDLTSSIGIIAGLVTLAAYIPYIKGILERKTRPNRATWWIWAVLAIVIAASYRFSGGIDSGWIAIGNAFGTSLIALLSLKNGEGGWTRLDQGCLLGAFIGIVAWALTNNPVIALIIATGADMLGAVPTIKKSYFEPEGENSSAWAIFLIGYTVNLFAMVEWSFALAFYPVYVFLLSAAMVYLLVFRKRDIRKK